jgi:hypothetical protein
VPRSFQHGRAHIPAAQIAVAEWDAHDFLGEAITITAWRAQASLELRVGVPALIVSAKLSTFRGAKSCTLAVCHACPASRVFRAL